ncbi:MAG: FAD-binding protein [Firmicutes bacterium]|nr:FAD-binding protein [Bacillota bacterium]
MSLPASISAREQTLLDLFRRVEHQGAKLKIQGLGHRLSTPKSDEFCCQTYSLAPWDALLSYHPADLVVSVEAGMSVSVLNSILREHDQWIPLTVADGQDDSIGGALSAGVDGIWRGAYGPFRDRVLGVVVATPGFGVIRTGGAVVKNVAGYNLPRLFLGSRGTLGVMTQVTLKVSPLFPEQQSWMWTDSMDRLIAKARQLISQARPWAALLLVQDQNQGQDPSRLWAAWHGAAIPNTVSLAVGGDAEEGATLPRLCHPQTALTWLTLRGAVPLNQIEALASKWEDGPLALECQSGDFFGFLPLTATEPMVKWIRGCGGGVRVLEGPELSTPPSVLEDYWTRLKKAYDPRGILV